MRVLLLNSFNDRTGLYEVIDYNIESATKVRLHVVDGDGLVELSHNGTPRDFTVSNESYLYGSTSVIRDRVLFSQPTEVLMDLGYSVYNFLADLVNATGAYLLRFKSGDEQIQYINGMIIEDGFANVESLRVSSSSMYVGAPYVTNNRWASLAIINSLPNDFSKEDGATVVHGKYKIAVDLEYKLTLKLCRKYCNEDNCKVIINGKECQLFSEPKLPVYCVPTPVEFYPLSLLHYLNFWKVSLHHFKFLVKAGLPQQENAVKSVSSGFRQDSSKRIAVVVSSNEDKFSLERRNKLIGQLGYVRDGKIDIDDIPMTSTEKMASEILLSELNRSSEEALPEMYKTANILEIKYSLSLMRLRTGMLYFPYCFEQSSGGRHLCYNGGGSMSGFATYLDMINSEERKVWSLAEGKLISL